MSNAKAAIRRSSATLMVALSMLLVAGTGAHASESFEDGGADAQALHLVLSIPSSDALKATLAQVGLPTTSIPAGLFKAQTLVIDVASNHGAVTVSGSQGSATAIAYSLTDSDGKNTLPDAANSTLKSVLKNQSVSSSCKWNELTHQITSCESDPAVAAQSITLPNGLGSIEIAGASSQSPNPTSTNNATSLVKVHLDLRGLFGGALSALAAPAQQVTDAVNTTLVPQVNTALKTVEGVVPKDTISGVTFGAMKALPSIATVPLLDLTVLPGGASISAEANSTKVKASATSEIEDLSLLGGWLNLATVAAKADTSYLVPSIPAVNEQSIANLAKTNYKAAQAQVAAINAKIKASGPAKSDAKSALTIGGGTVGGIATVDLSKVIDSFQGVAPIVQKTLASSTLAPVQSTLAPVTGQVVAAATLADQIAGIHLGRIAGTQYHKAGAISGLLSLTSSKNRITVGAPQTVLPDKEVAANAVSDQLVLDVTPNLPKISALTAAPAAGAAVPSLNKSDFVSSGVVLHVEMPKASAHVGDKPSLPLAQARTGVGTHALVAVMLIGAAVVVKKFVLTK